MTWNVNVAGVWKTLVSPAINVTGTYHNILQGWVNVGGVWKLFFAAFTPPVTNTHSTVGAFTETIPFGASNVIIGEWGAPGGGCQGIGTGCAADTGASGGSGAYAESSYSVAGKGGQTILGNIQAGGTAGGATAGAGGATTVSSGTFTLTTMTAPGGGGGANPSTAGAAGAIASGGTTTNSPGRTGVPARSTGIGGAGITGSVGTGPSGGNAGLGSIHPGQGGAPGQVTFKYT